MERCSPLSSDYWKAQERRVRDVLAGRGWQNARRNPGSGAGPVPEFKNDVWASWNDYLSVSVDHKSTRGEKTATLKREDLLKARRDALAVNDVPVVTFGFYQKQDIWAVVPLDMLLVLLENVDEKVLWNALEES